MFDNNIRENKEVRLSFDKLSQKTFDLSFVNWYQNGYWTEKYITYVLLQEEDTTLFVLSNKENVLADNQLMFPLLSHA